MSLALALDGSDDITNGDDVYSLFVCLFASPVTALQAVGVFVVVGDVGLDREPIVGVHVVRSL